MPKVSLGVNQTEIYGMLQGGLAMGKVADFYPKCFDSLLIFPGLFQVCFYAVAQVHTDNTPRKVPYDRMVDMGISLGIIAHQEKALVRELLQDACDSRELSFMIVATGVPEGAQAFHMV